MNMTELVRMRDFGNVEERKYAKQQMVLGLSETIDKMVAKVPEDLHVQDDLRQELFLYGLELAECFDSKKGNFTNYAYYRLYAKKEKFLKKHQAWFSTLPDARLCAAKLESLYDAQECSETEVCSKDNVCRVMQFLKRYLNEQEFFVFSKLALDDLTMIEISTYFHLPYSQVVTAARMACQKARHHYIVRKWACASVRR